MGSPDLDPASGIMVGSGVGALLMAVVMLFLMAFCSAAYPQVPPASLKYRPDLLRASQSVWGLKAPVPVFAAQIHQESLWRPDVCSPFACGLTQFTPDTAEWIQQTYGVELGAGDAKQNRFNPKWAILALVRYDKHLFDRLPAKTECDRMAFALSAYNGGAGWVNRDKKLTAAAGLDPELWWGNVELHTSRAKWAKEENRGYPLRILKRHQSLYSTWGRTIC